MLKGSLQQDDLHKSKNCLWLGCLFPFSDIFISNWVESVLLRSAEASEKLLILVVVVVFC